MIQIYKEMLNMESDEPNFPVQGADRIRDALMAVIGELPPKDTPLSTPSEKTGAAAPAHGTEEQEGQELSDIEDSTSKPSDDLKA